jgi:hypothetical protein
MTLTQREKLRVGRRAAAGGPEHAAASPSARADVALDVLSEVHRLTGNASLRSTDDLVAAGLSSLELVELAIQVQFRFGCDLTINDIWDAQTCDGIAAVLRGRKKSAVCRTGASTRKAGRASPQQRRFYRVHRPLDTTFSEVVACVLDLPETVDHERLKRTIDALLERHDSLRMSFETRENELIQVDSGNIDCPLSQVEAHSAWSGAGLEELLAREGARMYDPRVWPLFNVVVAETALGPRCLLSAYHMIIDGASRRILTRDFDEIYRSIGEHRAPELPTIALDYGAYSDWANWLGSQAIHRAAQRYWRTVFRRPFTPFHLSSPRAIEPAAEAAGYLRPLPADLSERLIAHARDRRASLFCLLMSGFLASLFGICEREEITVGVPTAGRNHADVTETVGLFSNSILVRVFRRAATNQHDLLADVGRQLISAQQHQVYQYDEIARDLELDFEVMRFPITGVYFNQASQAPAVSSQPIDAHRHYRPGGRVKYDLLANYDLLGSNIVFNFEYRKAAFDRHSIACFADGLMMHLWRFVRC